MWLTYLSEEGPMSQEWCKCWIPYPCAVSLKIRCIWHIILPIYVHNQLPINFNNIVRYKLDNIANKNAPILKGSWKYYKSYMDSSKHGFSPQNKTFFLWFPVPEKKKKTFYHLKTALFAKNIIFWGLRYLVRKINTGQSIFRGFLIGPT